MGIKNTSATDNVRRVKGSFSAKGRTFAVVVSDFNEVLTRELLSGALDTLLRQGARERDIRIFHVPGAFEIPLVARRLVRKKKWDAVITLAVVIRGQTRHFDQVVRETARSLRDICDRSGTPVILGVIPANTVAQAVERAGVKRMNKGREWALAAIEMANLMRHRSLKLNA